MHVNDFHHFVLSLLSWYKGTTVMAEILDRKPRERASFCLIDCAHCLSSLSAPCAGTMIPQRLNIIRDYILTNNTVEKAC